MMAQKESEKSPAVEAAKARQKRDEAVILSTGVKARFVPVASSLITDVVSAIKDPPIPVLFMKEKEREEENPNDPDYLRKMREAKEKRDKASLDTVILFGVDLEVVHVGIPVGAGSRGHLHRFTGCEL